MPLENFGYVGGNVWRCGQPVDQCAFDTLRRVGISATYKLDQEHEFPSATETRMLGDGGFVQIDEYEPLTIGNLRGIESRVLKSVAQLGAIAANTPVAVHCLHGSDRTGMIVGAFELLVLRISIEEVMERRKAYIVGGLLTDVADLEIVEVLRRVAA